MILRTLRHVCGPRRTIRSGQLQVILGHAALARIHRVIIRRIPLYKHSLLAYVSKNGVTYLYSDIIVNVVADLEYV